MKTAVLTSLEALKLFRKRCHAEGKRLALVPTMGNLHEGHLSLIKEAQKKADVVIVSVFVNPTQFGENEDVDTYPRTFDLDLKHLESLKVEAVFHPSVETMYPFGEKAAPRIDISTLMPFLCGKSRPGHFQGMATVVMKLICLTTPDVAVFGKKDYQQLVIIKRLVEEFYLPTEIVACPIMRESDGLAMSSRNQYLSAENRIKATELHQTLMASAKKLKEGEPLEKVVDAAKATLKKANLELDYLELRAQKDLTETTETEGAVLLISAYMDKVKLLDNIELD